MNDEDIKTEERIIKRLDRLKNVGWDTAVFNIKDVQDLLNLYNKEKEYLKIATAMLTKGTYPSEKEEDNDFEKQFIPVSKIKERIKEFAKEFVETEKIEEELIFYILEGK